MADHLNQAEAKKAAQKHHEAHLQEVLDRNKQRIENTSNQNRRKELERRRNALQRQLDRTKGRIKDLARRIHLLKKQSKESLHDIVGFDHTPVFRMQALMLQDCREHGWPGYLSSGIRWNPPAAEFGKKDQATLWRCSQNCTPDCNGDCLPANPPTQGTHLLLGDNVAYGKPIGEKLPDNDLGLDVSEWGSLMTIGRSLGYDLRQPYTSASEAHHLNAYNDIGDALKARGIV